MRRPALRALHTLILFCSLSSTVYAQDGWTYQSSFNFGFNLYFYTGQGQKFPGWKAYAGLSAVANHKDHFLLNYGPSLAIFSKSLGANLNPLVDDIQLDFANSFSIGGAWGDNPGYTKSYRTLGDAAYYNTTINSRNAVMLSTIFVFNNHKRNQALGAISGTFGDFTICYYNDGGAPIEWLPISDHFDRYWTGGLGLFFHSNDGFNRVEFSFDQFTGYEPLLYEMSSLLGIRIPNYNLQDSADEHNTIPTNFNTSAYNLRVFPPRGFAVDIGVIGSLKAGKHGLPFGLQDIIHTLGKYPLHPNDDVNRFYLGGTYNRAIDVRF